MCDKKHVPELPRALRTVQQGNFNESALIKVQKPSRYTGGELNAVHKDALSVKLSMALAFPDAYEVGMSHLGLKILYSIVNARPEL